MFPDNFIDEQRIGCQVEANSKKRVLEHLGMLLAQTLMKLPGLLLRPDVEMHKIIEVINKFIQPEDAATPKKS